MSYCDQNSNHKWKLTRIQALKALALKFRENHLVVTSGKQCGEGQSRVAGGARYNLLSVR